MQHEMKNLIKLFLCIVIVVLLVAVSQKIKLSDTNTIDLNYWTEEETALIILNKLIK